MHLHNHIFPSLLNGRGCPLWVGVGLLFLFVSCQKIDLEDIKRKTETVVPDPDDVPDDAPDDADDDAREVLVMTNDTAQFFVSKREVGYITLESIADPRTEFQRYLSPYRMPTRLEASQLRKCAVPDGYWRSGQRILCYDEATGVYYTFEFEGTSVTQAGRKTKYCVLGIRTAALPHAYEPTISIDDRWDVANIE